MEPLTAIYTADLFPALHARLIALLRGLAEEEWLRPTVAAPWRVRDIVAHLLDGDLRKLSGGRDRQALASRPLTSFGDIVALINDANATGVAYAARLSPRVMTDLLEITGRWVSEFVAEIPPHAPAHISVAWAGETQSENWMDIGREYTERWHHQMQIRDAVGADALLDPEWLNPLLDLSVRAFPRAYDGVHAEVGTAVAFEVDGQGNNVWSLVRDAAGWSGFRGRPSRVAASARVDPDTAWRLLYNALSSDEVRARVRIEGDRDLAEPMLRARSVMV